MLPRARRGRGDRLSEFSLGLIGTRRHADGAAPAPSLSPGLSSSWPGFRADSELAFLAVLGSAVYGAVVLALFGRRWLSQVRKRTERAPAPPLEPPEGITPPSGPEA